MGARPRGYVAEQVGELERRVLGEDPGPVARRTFNRGLSALVVGLLALAILAPISGIDLAAVLVWLVFVVLYVPPWESVPLVGRFIRPGMALVLTITYPFYW